MQVRILEQFVSSLSAPLRSAGANVDFAGLAEALAPYADWTIADFAAFLREADGFKRTGQVGIPHPGDAALKLLIEAFFFIRTAMSAHDSAGLESAQRSAADALSQAAAAHGLNVKPTIDMKWLANQKTEARTAQLADRLRDLARRVTGPESYAHLEKEIANLDALPAADWKLLAPTVPVKLPSKHRTVAALAYLSGHSAPTTKKSAKKPTFTPDQILPYVQRLRDRIERSNDRDVFPRAEVDAQIAELEPLAAGMIEAILKEANFSIAGKATKPTMLKKLREFLDAGHRAMEQVQA